MALRAVLDHPKTHHLTKLLIALGDRDRRATIGTLESLWHFAGRYTPQGDLGKYEDEVIEDWMGWAGEPGKLIDALITARWIDRDKEYRLLVHHWDEGCDEATKKAVHRKKNDDGSPKLLIGEMRKYPDGMPEGSTFQTKQSPLDPRFDEFKHTLLTWWGEINKKPVGMAAWGPGTTRALIESLRAEPELDKEELLKRLTFRFSAIQIARQKSKPERGDVNATSLLHEVIRDLPKFSDGPVNTFGDKL